MDNDGLNKVTRRSMSETTPEIQRANYPRQLKRSTSTVEPRRIPSSAASSNIAIATSPLASRIDRSSKVEAEANHLLQVEGRDYLMMEGIIRRRLNKDSEDLDNSFEVKINRF